MHLVHIQYTYMLYTLCLYVHYTYNLYNICKQGLLELVVVWFPLIPRFAQYRGCTIPDITP